MNTAMWDPVLKFFFLNSVFMGPVNGAQDPRKKAQRS